jgi:flagellar biosynthesis activator protein FlaF
MQSAAQAYKSVSRQTANPRELEATLLLQAAARLQSVHDSWATSGLSGIKATLDEALLYNRKLWSVFLTDMTEANNPLPRDLRQNVANLGLFVMNHTVSVLNDPRPERLGSLININREIAAGLLGRG